VLGAPSAPNTYASAHHKQVDSEATSGAPFDSALEPGIGNAPGCVQQWDLVTKTNRVVLYCGINSFLLDTVSAAQLWAWYEAFINARVAEGRKVTVVTLTPCGGHADCSAAVKTKITTFNASLLSWCASNPTQGCVNLYPLVDDGAGALKAVYDSGDRVHFTQPGYDLLAALVASGAGP
jgi:hypothetical protein